MPHDVTLIATFALGFALAFAFGYVANRLRLPPLVGYLVAGVVIGVYAPGAVADSATAGQLAEIGVILLMFGVGLHFSIDDLMAVRRIVFPGAIAQIVLATAIGAGLALAWGWSLGGGIVLGLCLSVASTVVLLKALEERNGVATLNGRTVVVAGGANADRVLTDHVAIIPQHGGLVQPRVGSRTLRAACPTSAPL